MTDGRGQKDGSPLHVHVNLGYRESNPGLLREQSLLRSESQRCYRYTIPDLIVSGSDRDCWLEVGPETEILSLSVHQLTKTMEPLSVPYPVHVTQRTFYTASDKASGMQHYATLFPFCLSDLWSYPNGASSLAD